MNRSARWWWIPLFRSNTHTDTHTQLQSGASLLTSSCWKRETGFCVGRPQRFTFPLRRSDLDNFFTKRNSRREVRCAEKSMPSVPPCPPQPAKHLRAGFESERSCHLAAACGTASNCVPSSGHSGNHVQTTKWNLSFKSLWTEKWMNLYNFYIRMRNLNEFTRNSENQWIKFDTKCLNDLGDDDIDMMSGTKSCGG